MDSAMTGLDWLHSFRFDGDQGVCLICDWRNTVAAPYFQGTAENCYDGPFELVEAFYAHWEQCD